MQKEHTHIKQKNTYVYNSTFDYCRPAGGNLSGSVKYEKCKFSRNHVFSIEHSHHQENYTNKLEVVDCEFSDLYYTDGEHIGSYYEYSNKSDGIVNIKDCKMTFSNSNLSIQFARLTGYDNVIIEGNTIISNCLEAKGHACICSLDNVNLTIRNNNINNENGCAFLIDNNVNNKKIEMPKITIKDNSIKCHKEFIETNVELLGNNPKIDYDNMKNLKITKQLIQGESYPLEFAKFPFIDNGFVNIVFDNDCIVQEFSLVNDQRQGGNSEKYTLLTNFSAKANTNYRLRYTLTYVNGGKVNRSGGITTLINVNKSVGCTITL